MRKFYFLIYLSLVFCYSAHTQTFSLVKNINPGTADGDPRFFTDVNGTLFFQVNDGVHGVELWKSNGAEAGTVMVKDINAGPADSYPLDLINVNGTVFFLADDGIHGEELWKSDGTEAGTVMVKDINPGIANSVPANFFKFNNLLFFSASNTTEGNEIWKTDGTDAGTVMVRDINPGTGSSYPISFQILGATLYFSAIDIPAGRELWKTDGTDAGTAMVKDIVPGPDGSYAAGLGMRVMNGAIFFAAGGAPPTSLWKSDGTEAGTVLVKSGGLPEWMMVSNGSLYFSAFGSGLGTELWKTDGTPAGTVMVKDINTSGSSYPNRLTNMNGTLFFLASAGSGNRLWKSDGTETGTVMVKDVEVSFTQQNTLTNVNGLLYCAATDNIHGVEIWKSNGTEAGTVMAQDIEVPGDAFPWEFGIAGSKLYASVTTSANGRELWAANIPAQGPLPLTILELRAKLTGNDGLLNWKTSFEENTSHFEIERSTNGRNFIQAGVVTAAGNSSTDKQYNYTDRDIVSLNAPVIYYRLKMKDNDNKFTWSRTIAVNISNAAPVVMLYPNPVAENATLMLSVTKKANITYRLSDASGKIIQSKNIIVNEGSNMIPIESSLLAAGVYIILLDGDNISSRVKLIKR